MNNDGLPRANLDEAGTPNLGQMQYSLDSNRGLIMQCLRPLRHSGAHYAYTFT
jgi:hypothetical protein